MYQLCFDKDPLLDKDNNTCTQSKYLKNNNNFFYENLSSKEIPNFYIKTFHRHFKIVTFDHYVQIAHTNTHIYVYIIQI